MDLACFTRLAREPSVECPRIFGAYHTVYRIMLISQALLTMRFEYFAWAGYPVTERDAATGTVVVPTSVPSVSMPLFNMSGLTIFAVMMVLHAISTLPGMWLMIYLIPVLAVFITVPAMTLVLVLDVWRRGLLSEWWSYSEV